MIIVTGFLSIYRIPGAILNISQGFIHLNLTITLQDREYHRVLFFFFF